MIVAIAIEHQSRFGIENLTGKSTIPSKVRVRLHTKQSIEPSYLFQLLPVAVAKRLHSIVSITEVCRGSNYTIRRM